MSQTIAAEGKEIIDILSSFPEFQKIAETPLGELNEAINGAVRQLASRSDSKAQEAVCTIRTLHDNKTLREAEERGCFIGPNPFCD